MPRRLAIGDIHGCNRALETLVQSVGLRPDDTIVTLGDYVNRGPNVKRVLDWLIEMDERGRLVALRGNHEIMMLRARQDNRSEQDWRYVGGDATLRSYATSQGERGALADIPEQHWLFLENRLAPWFETESHIFVHAGVYPDLPLEEQPDYMLYWEKYDASKDRRHQSGKTVVCGHTSQRSGLPITNGAVVCIDTWACGGGWLTCLDPESGEIWQANQAGQTRCGRLDELTSKSLA